jgi:protein gp37
MAATTNIAWCDSTFNPWIGCTKISPACDACYAAISTPSRTLKVEWGAGKQRHRTSDQTWYQPELWEKQHEQFFAKHRRRRRVFCASLADVFDNEVNPFWRIQLFELIARCKRLDWLLLTKRIGNALPMLNDVAARWPEFSESSWSESPWPHVWLGATIANQEEADRDIPKLLATPARLRFLSCEPLLGPIDLRDPPNDIGEPRLNLLSRDDFDGQAIDWVIAGGESGPKARPSHRDWFRSLRDQCAAAGVAFFMKQMGGVRDKRGNLEDLPEDLRIREFPTTERA